MPPAIFEYVCKVLLSHLNRIPVWRIKYVEIYEILCVLILKETRIRTNKDIKANKKTNTSAIGISQMLYRYFYISLFITSSLPSHFDIFFLSLLNNHTLHFFISLFLSFSFYSFLIFSIIFFYHNEHNLMLHCG